MLKYRIKGLRKEKGIRVVTLATKCQVTEKTIREWEIISKNEGKSIPSDMLLIIAKCFDLSMEEMYTENELITT
jgi:DNA-binding XRE family transcriptional regulator